MRTECEPGQNVERPVGTRDRILLPRMSLRAYRTPHLVLDNLPRGWRYSYHDMNL